MLLTWLAAAALQTQPPAPPAPGGPDHGRGFVAAASGLRYRVFPVPGAGETAIVAAVTVGAWHDPAGRGGMSVTMATLLELTQEERPAAERWFVKTTGPATLLVSRCPAAEAPTRLAELGRFLGGELGVGDDLAARAVAKARLRADDFTHYLPGPCMVEMVRRDLFRGSPVGRQLFGIPDEIGAITAAELRAWHRDHFRPSRSVLVVLGGVGAGVQAAIDGFREPGGAVPPAPPVSDDPLGPVVRERPHARVLAPFVTVAIEAPPASDPEFLPFLIAMHVVGERCRREFGSFRGGEAQAAFPFFWFNYRQGDRFAMINRRGEEDHGVDAVQAEVRAMLARLRTEPPPEYELRLAVKAAAYGVMMPPYEGQLADMAAHPQLLQPRAELLAMAEVLGWPPDLDRDLPKVLISDVLAALAKHLAADRLRWYALLPPAK